MMHQKELGVFEQCQDDIVERLCKLLMMTRSQMVNNLFIFRCLFIYGRGRRVSLLESLRKMRMCFVVGV